VKRIRGAEEEEKKKKWARAGGRPGWAGADAGRMSGASAGGGSSVTASVATAGPEGAAADPAPAVAVGPRRVGWRGHRRPEKEAQRARASVFRSGGDYFGRSHRRFGQSRVAALRAFGRRWGGGRAAGWAPIGRRRQSVSSGEHVKMPHVSAASAAGDDLGSTDEVKVFKDEGGADDDEKRSPDNNLNEEKNSLIDLTESQVRIPLLKTTHSSARRAKRTLHGRRRRRGPAPLPVSMSFGVLPTAEIARFFSRS
jgi:N-terminal CTNNB1 binding